MTDLVLKLRDLRDVERRMKIEERARGYLHRAEEHQDRRWVSPRLEGVLARYRPER